MKKLKKALIGSGVAVLGVTLLGGCGATNNTQSNNSSSDKQSTTEKKTETKSDNKSVDTSGLKEKKIAGASFKTSMLDKWKEEAETADLGATMLIDEETGNNITVSISAGAGGYGISSWDDNSASAIKEMLEKSGFQDITVGHTKLNGKEAFKVSYKIVNATIELYYIQLSDSKMAIVTYTVVKASDSFEKEIQNVVNSINAA